MAFARAVADSYTPNGMIDISVILPVYNAAATLPRCLESVVCQRVAGCELIIIDDGSTDGSHALIRKRTRAEGNRLNGRDAAPVKTIRTPHRGLVHALNTGIKASQGRYLARMDADDIMRPNRLAEQMHFLDRHPDIDVAGCRVQAFPPDAVTDGFRRYLSWVNRSLTHPQIIADLFRESPLPHPSVMMRRETILAAGCYRDFNGPEDYDLWLRLARSGARFAKLDKVLLDWRIRPDSLSRTGRRYDTGAFQHLARQFLIDFLREPGTHSGKDIWLCGGGRSGRRLMRWLRDGGIPAAGFYDVNPRRVNRSLDGLPVRAASEIETARETEFLLFSVGTWGAAELFESMMHRLGKRALTDYLVVHA